MGSERVTLRQFRAVEEGMSYGEVVRLLGREGTLDSRTDGSDGPVVASYHWWNDNKSYVEAAFENDRLVYKNQSRLRQGRSWPARLAPPRPAGASFERVPYVTLRQFRALERGMSYGKVVRRLGREGTPDSRADGFDSPVVATYYWWNDNKSYIEAAFENDRLVHKNQSRLRQVDPRQRPPLRLRSLGRSARASGRDAGAVDHHVAAPAGPHKFLTTWMPIGGTVLVGTIAFLAFLTGEGPPELSMIDIWLPSSIVAATICLLLAVAFGSTNPLIQLGLAVLAVIGAFGGVVFLFAFSSGEPEMWAVGWWLIFIGWWGMIMDPTTRVRADDAWIFGFCAAVSLAGAVLALI